MKKKKKEQKIVPVNLNNLEEMISLGYRNPLIPRDESVWTKTESEKKLLKKLRRVHKRYEFSSGWGFKKKSIPCYGKLIIQLHKNANFLKKQGYSPCHLTFSFKCGQSDIPNILNKFIIEVKENGEVVGSKSLVKLYKWNGKEYKFNELPFYYW